MLVSASASPLYRAASVVRASKRACSADNASLAFSAASAFSCADARAALASSLIAVISLRRVAFSCESSVIRISSDRCPSAADRNAAKLFPSFSLIALLSSVRRATLLLSASFSADTSIRRSSARRRSSIATRSFASTSLSFTTIAFSVSAALSRARACSACKLARSLSKLSCAAFSSVRRS